MWFVLLLLLLDGAYIYASRGASSNLISRMQGTAKTPVRILAIAFTYACIAALLYVFILKPKRSVAEAFLLGFGVYGIYEGTNYAVFKNWPLLFAVMDTLWGGTLYALTTLISYKFKGVFMVK